MLYRIKELRRQGYSTVRIAEVLGTTKNEITGLESGKVISRLKTTVSKRNPPLAKPAKPKTNPQETRKQNSAFRIRRAILAGEKSLEHLVALSGYFPAKFWEICNSFDINLPGGLVPYRHWPEVDERIDRGETLGEIARALGGEGINIRSYIGHSGQYNYWMQKRTERSNTFPITT